MASRLAWFPFIVDDWLGGTSAMLPAERGAYLSALLAQWQSGEAQAIPDNPARLITICGGPDFTPTVRCKFQEVKIKGEPYLRNKKLADLWAKQKSRHESASKGGKLRAKQIAEQSAEMVAEHSETLDSLSRASEPRKQSKDITRDLFFESLAEVCRIDWRVCTKDTKGAMNQTLGILRKEGKTAEEIRAVGDWWYANHWKGKLGQAPTPAEVREVWGQALRVRTEIRKAVIPG